MIRMSPLPLALALCLFAAPALAVDAPKGIVKLKSVKQGDVHLKHETHAALKCEVCHGQGEPGKMEGMNQKKGHALCQDCHKKDAAKKAPVKCDGCHHKQKPAAS
jgi:hypothetical protein